MPKFVRLLLALFFGALMLQSCGGGSGDDTSNATLSDTGTGLAIQVISETGASIELLPNTLTTWRVALSKADQAINAQLELETPVAGVQFQQATGGATLTIDTSGVPAGTTLPITLTAKNLDNGTIERATVVVKVLSPVVVATGTLLPAGNAVMSPDGSIGIQVDAGQLLSPLGVAVSTATTSSGVIKIRVSFDRDLGAERPSFTMLPLPQSTLLPEGAVAQGQVESSVKKRQAVSLPPYQLGVAWKNYSAYFTSLGSHRLKDSTVQAAYARCSSLVETLTGICVDFDPRAAQLASSISESALGSIRSTGKRIVPVLFVNGFLLRGALGGGEETWNDFPKLTRNKSFHNAEPVGHASERAFADPQENTVSW